MADEPAEERPYDSEEQEGGPVKSFLEHLEDLRWVLIKSCAAAGVAILLCLLGGNYVLKVLEWPLSRAPMRHAKGTALLRVTVGTNNLSVVHVQPGEPLASVLGTNSMVWWELAPIMLGTNRVMGVIEHTGAEAAYDEKLGVQIVNLSPAGSFVVATKVAFYAGLVISAPFIFYFVGSFVFPALRLRERKYVYRGLAFGGGLFFCGVSFCYFVLMPVALAASVQYAEWLGLTATQWRAEDYISFVCKFMLGMGLGFELPVVVLTMVKLGVLNYRILSKARRYVIVINLVLGAVLTTPEIVTQILMALPLQVLFEVSVWIAWYWERQERKKVAAAEGGAAAAGA